MNPNHIYVEPPFWVAFNEEEHAVKQLCVELEEQLNSSEPGENWNGFVQRCKKYWDLASKITIERYPVAVGASGSPLLLVPASSKIVLKDLPNSTELLDVSTVRALKSALNSP